MLLSQHLKEAEAHPGLLGWRLLGFLPFALDMASCPSTVVPSCHCWTIVGSGMGDMVTHMHSDTEDIELEVFKRCLDVVLRGMV